MKRYWIFIVMVTIAVSCQQDEVPSPAAPSTEENGDAASAIYLAYTPYYRESVQQWCAGVRVFNGGPAALPDSGAYNWQIDTLACDGAENWIAHPDSNYHFRSVKANASVFTTFNRHLVFIRASFNGTFTPALRIGKDLSAFPVTGCGVDPLTAPESLFVNSGSEPCLK